ncbi:MAG: GNAT family N-acetyltransferase [Pseudomonadota bacterium]
MIHTGIEIVRAGAASLEILEKLHGACFASGWDMVAFARLMAMPGATGTLALTAAAAETEAEALPVGFLLGREAAGEAEIISFGVLPEFRGRGIGGALLQEYISRMRERGVAALFLETATDNDAAISLYKRLGFASVGLRRGYYEAAPGAAAGASDALIMRRNI